MPGLIGAVGSQSKEEIGKLLEDMAQSLKHEDWYKIDLHWEDEIGLGRISLGILNPEPQPIWNEDHTFCIVMEGEVYDYEDEKQKLIDRGHRFQVNNDAEFVLHLFEEFGPEAPILLNGAFVAAVWDVKTKRLTIFNDRLGLRPLYYVERNGSLIFASGVRALLANQSLPRRVDPLAIAQFLCFDHVLGHRTLLSDVHLQPPASLLTFRDNRLTIQVYWTLEFPEVYEPRSEEACLDELIYHLRQAVVRQAHDDLPAGVSLSGGIDSRMIMAMLRDLPRGKLLQTFTYGTPHCDDVRFARELAALANVRHHFFELKPDYLLDMADEAVRLTDGMNNCVHLHSLATLRQQSEHVRVLYMGFMGDAVMGFGINRQLLTYCNKEAQSRVHFRVHTDQNLIVFPPSEQDELLNADFLRQIDGALLDSYRDVLAESSAKLAADQRIHWDLRQRVRRMTINGPELVSSRLVVRTPYCDNDLVDFVSKLPPGLRLHRYLMIRAVAQAFPTLAKVPTDKTLHPLIPCARDLRIRINNQTRSRLLAAGLKWLRLRGHRPYADYNGWMRTSLRPLIEKKLLSNRSLERGYFNPEYVRNLVSQHMAGANHDRKLGGLLTLELWHQQFID